MYKTTTTTNYHLHQNLHHQNAYSRLDRLLKTIHLSPDASRTQINVPVAKPSKQQHSNSTPNCDGELPEFFNQMGLHASSEPRSLDVDAVAASTSNGRPSRSQTKSSQKVGKPKFEWTDLFPSGDLYPLVSPVGRVQRLKPGESLRDNSPVSSPRWPKSSVSLRLPSSAQKNQRTSASTKVPPANTAQTDDWNKAVNIWTDSILNTLPTFEPQLCSSAGEVRNGSARSLPSHATPPRASTSQTSAFFNNFGATTKGSPASPLYQSLNSHRNSPSTSSGRSSYQVAPTSLSSRGLPRSSKLLLTKEQKGNAGAANATATANAQSDSGRGDKCDLEPVTGDEDILDRYFRQAPSMLYNEISETKASEDDDEVDDERLISITGLISTPPISLESTRESTTDPSTTAPIGGPTVTATTARNDNNGIVSRSVTASKRKERIAERPNSS